MTTSLSWIKGYVRNGCAGIHGCDGSKVEGYEKMDEDLEKIVVGQVLKIEKHRMQTN